MKLKLFICVMVVAYMPLAFAQGNGAVDVDTTLPIEIEADKLLVMQEDTLAVFTGNVEAKQGNIYLRSYEMKVHYRPKKEKNEKQNAVERIDVKGDVMLSTPKETASGDKGYFKVDERIIVLTGNVTLTQNDTIVQGNNLYYNMKTGRSEIKSNSEDNGTNSRVRMVTQPSKLQKQ